MPDVIVRDGTRIHYQRFGRHDGEPVVLIQGLGADSSSWLLQRFPFGKQYRCVAPDNRGAGRSDVPPGPYDLEVMADDVLSVMDAEGIDSAHIVGVSMGGILAQILGVRHPERVRSLVLSCTACHHHPWRRQLLEEWAEAARTVGMSAFLGDGLRWIVGSRSMRRFWPAMRLFGPIAFDISADAFVAQIEAILAMDDALRHELDTIAVPTLVIVGSQDVLTPLADSEELTAHIAGARLAVVRGGAHGFMVEKAGVYNATILEFLDGVVAAQAAPSDRGLAVAG